MAIDETGLVNGELYTIVLNKDARGRKGSIAALIKGTKGKDIANAITNSVPFSTRMKIKEITLDMANNMNWIVRQIAPNAIRTYDRFHVQQIVFDAVQTIRVHFRWEAINQDNEAVARAKELGIKYNPKIFTNGDTKKQLLARSRLRAKINGLILKKQELKFYLLNIQLLLLLIIFIFNLRTLISTTTKSITLRTGLKRLIILELKRLLVWLKLLKLT
jgi:hypothetical protein